MFDYECGMCSDAFNFREDRDQHMVDEGHLFFCQTCSKTFWTYRACQQHMEATNHGQRYYSCKVCGHKALSELGFELHEEVEGHHSDRYCADCSTHFDTEHSLKQHLKSGTHLGKTVDCRQCGYSFVTVSGLVHHLETGSCNPKGMNLSKADRRMRARFMVGDICDRDPKGIITNQSVTQKGWACDLCGEEFHEAIDQALHHLDSSDHDGRMWCCPNPHCRKTLTSLAGLANHLESGACDFVRFQDVEAMVTNWIYSTELIKWHGPQRPGYVPPHMRRAVAKHPA